MKTSTTTNKPKKSVYDRLARTETVSSASKKDPIKETNHSSEITELTQLVEQLKKESVRHLELECETQNEFEFMNAQLRSNRAAVGKIADIIVEDFDELRQEWTRQLQEHKIETNQRFTELQNAMERIEFRFAHHIRDCQSMGDEVDRHHDQLGTLKTQMANIALEMEKQMDIHQQQIHLIKVQSEKTEERVLLAAQDTTNTLEHFQHRLKVFSKELQESFEALKDATRLRLSEFETVKHRQAQLLHKTMDELIQLKEQLGAVDILRNMLETSQQRMYEVLEHRNKDSYSIDHRLNQLEATLEAQRTSTRQSLQLCESSIKAKISTLAQTIQWTLDLVQQRNEPPP